MKLLALIRVLNEYPGTRAEDWTRHPNCGGWVTKAAAIDPEVVIPKNTILAGDRITLRTEIRIEDFVRAGDVSIGDGAIVEDHVVMGNGVRLENHASLHDHTTLGDRVSEGQGSRVYNATLGDDVMMDWNVSVLDGTIGKRVTIGFYTTLGKDINLGDEVAIGNEAKIGTGVTLGDGVRLGNDVELGDGASFLVTPLQIEGSRGLCHIYDSQLVKIGRHIETLENWFNKGLETLVKDEHKRWLKELGTSTQNKDWTDEEVAEYQGYLELIRSLSLAGRPNALRIEGDPGAWALN